MDKSFWIRKITSRKLWVAVAAFVTSLLVGFGVDTNTTEKVVGIIMAGATAIAYIIGEGLIDVESAKASKVELPNLDLFTDDLKGED